MVIGVLRLELLLYSPGSLKEKRGIVRKILDRCRVRFPVSCAETGLQDVWQRSELGFALVGHKEDSIRATFERLEEEVESSGSAIIAERHVEILHYS